MTMDHDRARDLFTQYHEEDLSDAELAELEEHLAECDECREEWETYRKTIDGVSGLFELAAPEDFTRSVEQKIRKRSRGRFCSEPLYTAICRLHGRSRQGGQGANLKCAEIFLSFSSWQ